jgi:hypothetical protein
MLAGSKRGARCLQIYLDIYRTAPNASFSNLVTQ